MLPTWSIDVMAGMPAANLDHESSLRTEPTFKRRLIKKMKRAGVPKGTWSGRVTRSPGLLSSTHSFSKERQTFLACSSLREDTNPDDSEAHALSPSMTFQAHHQ